MKTHVEIIIRFKRSGRPTLHQILNRFASDSTGWEFPYQNSEEYQTHNGSEAGFVVWLGKKQPPAAAVAIANLDAKNPDVFCVPNIVPRAMSCLSLEEYNAIGTRFAKIFHQWLKKSSVSGSVQTIGPIKTLGEIIRGPKSRRFFEAWIHSPTPLSHPCDLDALNRFICYLFRHRGKTRTWEIEPYLVHDLGWTHDAARTAVAKIDAGLELLRVDRKF